MRPRIISAFFRESRTVIPQRAGTWFHRSTHTHTHETELMNVFWVVLETSRMILSSLRWFYVVVGTSSWFWVVLMGRLRTTVLCLLGRKTLTMGLCGDRGLARVASPGVGSTARLLEVTEEVTGVTEVVTAGAEPKPLVASSSCCSLCWRASSLLVYSSYACRGSRAATTATALKLTVVFRLQLTRTRIKQPGKVQIQIQTLSVPQCLDTLRPKTSPATVSHQSVSCLASCNSSVGAAPTSVPSISRCSLMTRNNVEELEEKHCA